MIKLVSLRKLSVDMVAVLSADCSVFVAGWDLACDDREFSSV